MENRPVGRPKAETKAPKAPYQRKERVAKLCEVGGCAEYARDVVNAKYCELHGQMSRWSRHRPRTIWKPTDDERFWLNVDKQGEDDCWVWAGRSRSKKGGRRYGQFGYQSRTVSAHRYSFELENGVKLESHTPIHHTCGETLCVNPKHLQATTPHENTAEMLERRWYQKRIAELEAQVAACTCG